MCTYAVTESNLNIELSQVKQTKRMFQITKPSTQLELQRSKNARRGDYYQRVEQRARRDYRHDVLSFNIDIDQIKIQQTVPWRPNQHNQKLEEDVEQWSQSNISIDDIDIDELEAILESEPETSQKYRDVTLVQASDDCDEFDPY